MRNLEKKLELRVIDRSELILDIFAQRAATREARIQVELAQLRYLMPRLTGLWHHFDRIAGGIGTRGPGETQLEIDRRIVRKKIATLQKQLEGVEVERRTQSSRRGTEFRVSLVGYTNVGKSTIFNQLTGAGVFAEDKLFATLDTTTRKVFLDGNLQSLVSDTVGFIRKLPHHLIASFRATFREVENADLLVHVVDASHSSYREQIQAVDEVLEEILEEPIPKILVFNKADLLEGRTDELEFALGFPDSLLMSAHDPDGIKNLRLRIAETVRELRTLVRIECAATRHHELERLIGRGEKRSEQFLEDRFWSEVYLDHNELAGLKRAGFSVQPIRS